MTFFLQKQAYIVSDQTKTFLAKHHSAYATSLIEIIEAKDLKLD